MVGGGRATPCTRNFGSTGPRWSKFTARSLCNSWASCYFRFRNEVLF